LQRALEAKVKAIQEANNRMQQRLAQAKETLKRINEERAKNARHRTFREHLQPLLEQTDDDGGGESRAKSPSMRVDKHRSLDKPKPVVSNTAKAAAPSKRAFENREVSREEFSVLS
jgi:hypothetical protein